jgi:hypothetical protein
MDTNIAEPSRVRSFQPRAGERRPVKIGDVAPTNAVSSATLYRVASVAGAGSALILLVNAAKRASLIPTTNLTQLLAPLAEVLALGFVVGLFMAFGRRAGLFGLVAFIINFIALACLEGIEVVINLIFATLPKETIVELLSGPLGLMLTATSLLFLLGSIAFVTSMLQAKSVPRLALALYALASVPIAFRAFVPELALDLGLAALAISIGWLSASLWTYAGTTLNIHETK